MAIGECVFGIIVIALLLSIRGLLVSISSNSDTVRAIGFQIEALGNRVGWDDATTGGLSGLLVEIIRSQKEVMRLMDLINETKSVDIDKLNLILNAIESIDRGLNGMIHSSGQPTLIEIREKIDVLRSDIRICLMDVKTEIISLRYRLSK